MWNLLKVCCQHSSGRWLYDIPTHAVLERTVSKYLRRRIGVPPSFTNIGLYRKTTKLKLPLSSVLDEFKVSTTRMVITLRDSRDQVVRQAGIKNRTGRKWSASLGGDQAETRLRHRDIVGTPCEGRIGLENSKQNQWKTAESQERRDMVGQPLNGRGNVQYEPVRSMLLLISFYDVLPSPFNLYQGNLTGNPNCRFSEKKNTFCHRAKWPLRNQGRYIWRHD